MNYDSVATQALNENDVSCDDGERCEATTRCIETLITIICRCSDSGIAFTVPSVLAGRRALQQFFAGKHLPGRIGGRYSGKYQTSPPHHNYQRGQLGSK